MGCRRWHRSIRKVSASRVQGLHGGLPGGGVRGVVLDPDGNVVHDCGTGELVTLTRTDQIVEVRLAGGAGFGDPASRDRARLEEDIADGYVSADGAGAYGTRKAAATAAE